MIDLQQDMTDVIARDLKPHIVKIAERALTTDKWTNEQQSSIEHMLAIFRDFDGSMEENSIPATIYSYWQYFFYQRLFNKYTFNGEKGAKLKENGELFWSMKKSLLLVDNYAFYDYYQRMLYSISAQNDHARFQHVCQDYDSSFKGKSQCEHNVALAFFEAHNFLKAEISTKEQDWQWKFVHANEYSAQPWAMTKLKPLWNREVPVGGNMNTPCVSKYSMAKVIDNKIFLSTHTANYKQVIEFNSDPRKDKNLMSIDTGMSGNLFGGNYFTMNAPHLRGELN